VRVRAVLDGGAHSYQAKDRTSNNASRIRGIPPCGRISNIQRGTENGKGRKRIAKVQHGIANVQRGTKNGKGRKRIANVQHGISNVQRGTENGKRKKENSQYPIYSVAGIYWNWHLCGLPAVDLFVQEGVD
jgi:hypothetical protein